MHNKKVVVIILLILISLASSCSFDFWEGRTDDLEIYNGCVFKGNDNWLFYYPDDLVRNYMGMNYMPESEMEEFIGIIHILDDLCIRLGKTLVIMAQPNKNVIYYDKMPSQIYHAEKTRFEFLTEYVKENSTIKIAYAKDELLAAKEKYQVYYAHDTHWNTLGAFVGAQKLYETLGLETTDITEISPVKKDIGGVGDLISLGKLDSNVYNTDVDYDVVYKGSLIDASSRMDLAVDYTENPSAQFDLSLVYFGDSYRVFMAPFLKKDFSKSTIVSYNDMNYDFVNEAVKDADIIVITTVERYMANILKIADSVLQILQEVEK